VTPLTARAEHRHQSVCVCVCVCVCACVCPLTAASTLKKSVPYYNSYVTSLYGVLLRIFCLRWGRLVPRSLRARYFACVKFWKVIALLYLLYKVTNMEYFWEFLLAQGSIQPVGVGGACIRRALVRHVHHLLSHAHARILTNKTHARTYAPRALSHNSVCFNSHKGREASRTPRGRLQLVRRTAPGRSKSSSSWARHEKRWPCGRHTNSNVLRCTL